MGWLAHTTWPDLVAFHSFLSSYSNEPSASHMKAALYALHFIYSHTLMGFPSHPMTWH